MHIRDQTKEFTVYKTLIQKKSFLFQSKLEQQDCWKPCLEVALGFLSKV